MTLRHLENINSARGLLGEGFLIFSIQINIPSGHHVWDLSLPLSCISPQKCYDLCCPCFCLCLFLSIVSVLVGFFLKGFSLSFYLLLLPLMSFSCLLSCSILFFFTHVLAVVLVNPAPGNILLCPRALPSFMTLISFLDSLCIDIVLIPVILNVIEHFVHKIALDCVQTAFDEGCLLLQLHSIPRFIHIFLTERDW